MATALALMLLRLACFDIVLIAIIAIVIFLAFIIGVATTVSAGAVSIILPLILECTFLFLDCEGFERLLVDQEWELVDESINLVNVHVLDERDHVRL